MRRVGWRRTLKVGHAAPDVNQSMTALRLYTDGSCHPPGPVGEWAWFLVNEHAEASNSDVTPGPSNHQQCELTAAIEGLTYLVASGVREVELLSDSRYVVRGDERRRLHRLHRLAHAAAEREWRNARGKPLKNPDLWERLLELAACLAVTWRHVPGHRPKKDTSNDARYNREVDALAREARLGVLSLGVQSGVKTTLWLLGGRRTPTEPQGASVGRVLSPDPRLGLPHRLGQLTFRPSSIEDVEVSRPSVSSSTVRYESRTTIDRTIEEVFARLADLPAYSSWMHRTGLFRRCGQLSDGPIGKGTTYFDATRMGTYRGEVTDFERPSRIGFRETLRWFGSAVAEARAEYFLDADDEKRTIVHHVAEGELFGWMRLMKPGAALLARSERARTLKSLRRSLASD